LHRDFKDYADQKNYAMAQCSGDWLVSLDADEELTPELQAEIRETIKNDSRYAAYRIRRISNIFGRWFRFTGTQDDKPVRLFRAGKAQFSQRIHEVVAVDGACGNLNAAMRHFTYPTSRGYIERFNRYTTLEAELLSTGAGKPEFREYFLKPVAMFLKLYVWKLGFLDGPQGLVFSLLSGCYVFTKHAKQWEIARARRG
jgi:glycosyltransferase involved in cell wall biosynthesis